eukprot:Clim_evm82s150 gene=Clim_evmTU82s150
MLRIPPIRRYLPIALRTHRSGLLKPLATYTTGSEAEPQQEQPRHQEQQQQGESRGDAPVSTAENLDLDAPPPKKKTPDYVKQLKVYYAMDADQAESYIQAINPNTSGRLWGFDLEWKAFNKTRWSPTALLQISNNDTCYLFHLAYFSRIPPALREFIEDQAMIKSGVALQGDYQRFKKDFGIYMKGAVDFQRMDLLKMTNKNVPGMGRLTEKFLKLGIAKSKKVSLSNWENYPLTSRQLLYAAQDAWLSYAILPQAFNSFPHDPTGINGYINVVDFITRRNGWCNQEQQNMDFDEPWAFEQHRFTNENDLLPPKPVEAQTDGNARPLIMDVHIEGLKGRFASYPSRHRATVKGAASTQNSSVKGSTVQVNGMTVKGWYLDGPKMEGQRLRKPYVWLKERIGDSRISLEAEEVEESSTDGNRKTRFVGIVKVDGDEVHRGTEKNRKDRAKIVAAEEFAHTNEVWKYVRMVPAKEINASTGNHLNEQKGSLEEGKAAESALPEQDSRAELNQNQTITERPIDGPPNAAADQKAAGQTA